MTSHYPSPVPTLQADAVLSQVNPVSGTLYTVLSAVSYCRIISASTRVTWTVQPSPLEIHASIDGITKDGTKTNPVTATDYLYRFDSRSATGWGLQVFNVFEPFVYECRTTTITAETTGGTTQNLSCRVRWAKY